MIHPQRFKTKPVVTEQVRFEGFASGSNGFELLDWLNDAVGVKAVGDGPFLHLDTREREDATARPGDWIVIGTEGEVYPISDAVHQAKYEPAD